MLKRCTRCTLELPLDSFSTNRTRPDGKCSACRACHNKYTKRHYQANKPSYFKKAKVNDAKLMAWIDSLKDNPCTDCGIKYKPWQMDFDHVLGEKQFNIAFARSKKLGRSAILSEIAKCELVCANCHRDRTHNRLHASSGGSSGDPTKVVYDCSIQS